MSRDYVTEVYPERSGEPPELQRLHKMPMEAEADKPASPGPRTDQTQRGTDQNMSTPTLTRDAEPRTASNSPERLRELADAERAATRERDEMRHEWAEREQLEAG